MNEQEIESLARQLSERIDPGLKPDATPEQKLDALRALLPVICTAVRRLIGQLSVGGGTPEQIKYRVQIVKALGGLLGSAGRILGVSAPEFHQYEPLPNDEFNNN